MINRYEAPMNRKTENPYNHGATLPPINRRDLLRMLGGVAGAGTFLALNRNKSGEEGHEQNLENIIQKISAEFNIPEPQLFNLLENLHQKKEGAILKLKNTKGEEFIIFFKDGLLKIERPLNQT